MSTPNVITRQKVQVFISFGVSIFDCFILFEVEKEEIGNIRGELDRRIKRFYKG